MLSRYKSLQVAAFEDFAEGRISKQESLSRKKESADCQEEVKSRIAELNDQLAKVQSQQAVQQVDIGNYVYAHELTREILVELVKEIQVSEDNRIEAIWNFHEKL